MKTLKLLLLPGALLAAFSAGGQAIPDAGSVLQQLRSPVAPPPQRDDSALPAAPPLPAPAAGNGQALLLRQVRITGATVFPEAELQQQVRDAIGRELDLAGLEAVADRISRYYRQRGYTVARAYLPPQEVRDGTLEVAVVEGRLGAINVRGPAPSTLPLAALVEGEVVTDAALERSLLLASEVPGIAVRSTLQPGASVGTSELVVDVASGPRLAGRVEADNYGSRSTGRNRVGGTLAVNNPAGLGDLASLRAIVTDEALGYGRAAWQVPVNRNGTQVGVAASLMHYELAEEFASLDAHGTARIASLFAVHPLLRSRMANANVQLAYDAKRLEDRADAVGSVNERSVQALSLGLAGDRSDAAGAWSYSLTYTRGHLDIETPAARELDAATARTAGGYDKLGLAFVRQQALGPASSLLLAYTGQWARKNLDSSEKLPLGGMAGVRAYPQGEWPSDRAHLLTLELRHALAAQWHAIAFADTARGEANADPWTGTDKGRRTLSGAGLGLAWAGGPGLTARLLYAHKLGNTPATAEPDSDHRVWLQAGWTF